MKQGLVREKEDEKKAPVSCFARREKEHCVLVLTALILNLASSQGSRVGKSARGVLINSHGTVTHRQQPRAGYSCFQSANPRVVLG